MNKEHFFVNIVGIVFDTTQREILIAKKHEEKEYTFIEGELSHDIELDKCLKKIIKEQTGYTVHNLGSMYSENMLEDKDKLNLYFLCEVRDRNEKVGEYIDELKWIDPCKAEKIMNRKFPTRLKEFIHNLGVSCHLEE